MNSFKKLATVLAAALTLGVMSALPTQATVYADVVTIDAVADTINPGETATAVVSVSFLGTSVGDTVSVISAVLSSPSTASVPQFAVTETSSATVALSVDTKTAAVSPATNTTGYVTAKLTSSFYVPSVAGTYVVRFIPTLTSASGSVTSAAITWTVTVTAPDLKASTAYTTSILNAGETISAIEAPGKFVALSTTEGIKLRWFAPSATDGLTGYLVEIAPGGKEWQSVATVPVDQTTLDMAKSDGGWTQFRVSSVYSDGQVAPAKIFGLSGQYK